MRRRPLRRRLLPTQLSGCVLWLDAARGITLDTGVSQWADQSGSGNHVVQATGGSQPTYNASSTLMPGRPSLTFDGTADHLTLDAFAAAYAGSDKALSVVAVVSTTTTTGTRSVVSWGRAASSVPFLSLEIPGNTTFRLTRRDDANLSKNTTAAGNAVNTPCVVSAVFTGTSGSLIRAGSAGNLAADLDVGTITLDQFAVGCLRRNTNTQFWSGDIWELMVYNRALALSERKGVERFLAKRYRQPVGVTV
jgi:hypothetical protein